MVQTLYLIRGLPGSGKSTLAEFLATAGFRHFEADFWMTDGNGNYKFDPDRLREVHRVCQKACEYALELGHSVVIANTFVKLQELEPYFAIAKQFGITPNVVECTGNFGSVRNVPEETMQKMRKNWEKFTTEVV